MQFKHPELLYALLLLIIPIIVHLFQLRRFQKVQFTNVKFLKNITQQTRKSSKLKKWLTLLTRLLLLACIIIAFAQPFTSNTKSFNTKNEIVIYLDNSFSMQAKSDNGTLLNKAIQELIETVDENENISFFTNNNSYRNTTLKAIKNDIIKLNYAPKQLSYDAVFLKAQKLFSNDKSSLKNLVLISDFQSNDKGFTLEKDTTFITSLVQLKPQNTNNIALDSLYVSKTDAEHIELTLTLKNQGSPVETLPVSLFNAENLIAKSSVSIDDEISTTFKIPVNQPFNGKISIEYQNLQYDNTLFFNIDKREKINVLSINEMDDSFLKRIYTEDEFNYTSTRFNNLNYNSINDQNLIILNELKEVPNSLITTLKAFTDNGGYLLIVPSDKSTLNSYNQLLNNYNISQLSAFKENEKRVTSINFSHPLFTNVFDKKVTNFQYPKVNSYYGFTSNNNASILSFEDNNTFLTEANNVYVFSAPLNEENSNFQNSPLIVPVLYNIGKQSLKLSELYYTIGNENTIDINLKLSQDDILSLKIDESSVIPLQQTYANKVEITTNEFPENAGIIAVMNKDRFIKNLSFNYNRNESNLNYLDLSNYSYDNIGNSVTSALNDIKSSTNVNALWKWFVIFALAFLVIEMLILKLLK